MKVLISTLVSLTVGTAVAATTSTSLPASTGTSSTTLSEVAPKKSNLSTVVEITNEKSHSAIENESKDLETAVEPKVTYKLSDTQSIRGSAYVRTLTRDSKDDTRTDLAYVYLQYADSALFKVGNQAFRGAIRQYYLGFGDLSKDGSEGVTRLYLSTPFVINEKVTVTPILNPRIYMGSEKRDDAGKPRADLVSILETELALSSNVSYTLDLIRRDRNTKDGTNDRFEIDNWITVGLVDKTAITEAITMDAGFYHGGNSGNGFTLNKDGTVYYIRANVNF